MHAHNYIAKPLVTKRFLCRYGIVPVSRPVLPTAPGGEALAAGIVTGPVTACVPVTIVIGVGGEELAAGLVVKDAVVAVPLDRTVEGEIGVATLLEAFSLSSPLPVETNYSIHNTLSIANTGLFLNR